MPKIVFWSPQAASVGQTHAVIAAATMMAIQQEYSNLVLHAHWKSKKIETAFSNYDTLKKTNIFNSSSLGITALTRLIETNKLTPESVRNYAKPVLKQRLDIMYGTSAESREQFIKFTDSFSRVVQVSSQSYDVVWVDCPKSEDREYIKNVVKDADLVVCTLNQEVVNLDECMELYNSSEVLKDKKKIILLCNYEARSSYNIPNIKRKYGIKDVMMSIPRNYIFADACNDGKIVDFFYRNLNADHRDYNGIFIKEVKSLIDKILELVNVIN
jgi:cellulose biosynthesis protein BcsQ